MAFSLHHIRPDLVYRSHLHHPIQNVRILRTYPKTRWVLRRPVADMLPTKSIVYLGPQYARFPPKFYYWFFIPCDVLSLVLQAVGGALSSVSEGGSDVAVNVSIAGLSFQVVVIVVFIALTGEYVWRYRKGQRLTTRTTPLSKGFKIFSYFMAISITFILIRCCYRIDELSEGYSGDLIHNEGLFIALEGV